MQTRYAASGRETWFQALSPFLTGDTKPDHDALAAELGTTPAAVRVAVHRLRRKYREALAAEIAGTLGDVEEVNDERVTLLNALMGK